MRVVMLSQNERRHDSRVIREAEALAQSGYDVHVVCRGPVGTARQVEEANSVRYLSIPRIVERPADLPRLFRGHIEVLRRDVELVGRGQDRVRGSVSALRLCGLLLFAPLAALALGVLRLTRRAPLSRRDAVGRQVLDYVDGIRYLNDYARACADVVVGLGPDVVHAHDLITLSGGAIAARRTGATLVYDAHELETHTNYHSLSARTQRWIALYEAVLTQWCGAIVTVCDSIADWLAREYEVERPVVVMNAPRRAQTARVGASLRSKLALADDVPLVVYVGSVTVDRGLELTVEALRFYPEAHLATVGPRYGPVEDAMRRIAETHGIADRLHFVDPVPSDEVVCFVSEASVSVIPIQNVCLSYAFTFPNKLLESVFAGVPVAVANLVELRRFIEAHPVGLVMDVTDPAAIAATLATLVTRREHFAPDAAELDRIEAEYGWELQQTRLRLLYASFGPTAAASSTTPRSMSSTVAP
jgi:glycosyltransferase involved in cell wall biosynthesis